MTALQELEAVRQESQVALDALKTSAERNELGQFATPNSLAIAIMEYLRDNFGIGEDIRFLEPAIGLGSFYSALLRVFGQPDKSVGVELDKAFYNRASELWEGSGLELVNGDFTKQEPAERFNLLVTNPPYVRHHHIEGQDKADLAAWASKRFGLKVSGLSGLYCHFVYKAHEWLEDDAISVWLIPSEFMDVNYGEALKQYLCRFVTLESIHRFNPEDVQFTDALVSSAILVFRNRKPSAGHKVRMTFGGTLAVPAFVEEVPIGELDGARKWSIYPHRDLVNPRAVHTGLVLGDLFTVKRGLATGDNRFFIIERHRASELGIPEEFLRPILPSTRYITGTVVEADSDGYALTSPQLALIDCRLPEEQVKKEYPKFWKYLQSGIDAGVTDGYLTKGRKPWYSQENRQASPFVCTYLGRPKKGVAPFRFILNVSKATATNVYLLLYPKPHLMQILIDKPELARAIVDALNNVGEQAFFSEGRVYGGGLHKMEPKELMRLPLVGEPFDSLAEQPPLL